MSRSADPCDLQRFLDAQQATYATTLAELRAGRKQSHWIWFILPQPRGLGTSAMSVRYAIGSLDEARAFLAHPLLGARLRECVATMNAHDGLAADEILGELDARKFHSCLTLFAAADPAEPLFAETLRKYYGGRGDAATLARLQGARDPAAS